MKLEELRKEELVKSYGDSCYQRIAIRGIYEVELLRRLARAEELESELNLKIMETRILNGQITELTKLVEELKNSHKQAVDFVHNLKLYAIAQPVNSRNILDMCQEWEARNLTAAERKAK